MLWATRDSPNEAVSPCQLAIPQLHLMRSFDWRTIKTYASSPIGDDRMKKIPIYLMRKYIRSLLVTVHIANMFQHSVQYYNRRLIFGGRKYVIIAQEQFLFKYVFCILVTSGNPFKVYLPVFDNLST